MGRFPRTTHKPVSDIRHTDLGDQMTWGAIFDQATRYDIDLETVLYAVERHREEDDPST